MRRTRGGGRGTWGGRVVLPDRPFNLSLVQTVAGATTTRFVYASGLLVARTVSGTTAYLHQDPLGSVRATSDANGNWAYVTAYKPFGQEYATSGSYASLKYTGRWKDANTGLYYLYRRFYDPDLGRTSSRRARRPSGRSGRRSTISRRGRRGRRKRMKSGTWQQREVCTS